MADRVAFIHRRWFQIFVGGSLLFVAAEQALKITGNPNFFPTVILLGAFLVPVTFIAYIYEKVAVREIPVSCMGICFLGGGTIGVVAAGILEYKTLSALGVSGLFGVGLIEESAKLILPVAMYIRSQYKREADGLFFGVMAGMGFAALETMGYGLVSLIRSQGNVGVLEEVLLVRGLVSPAGHAAWTGLICAVAWRERERTGRALNLAVLGAFVMAVVLHVLWDVVNSLDGTQAGMLFVVIAGNLFIAVLSMALLIRRIRESGRAPQPQPLDMDGQKP